MQSVSSIQVPDFTGNLSGEKWYFVSNRTGTDQDSSNNIGNDEIHDLRILCNIFSSLGESSKLMLKLSHLIQNGSTNKEKLMIKGKIIVNSSIIRFEAPVLEPLYNIMSWAIQKSQLSTLADYSEDKPKCIEFYSYVSSASGKFRNLSNNIILKFKFVKNSSDLYNNFSISLMNLGQRCELPMSSPPYVKEESCCEDTA